MTSPAVEVTAPEWQVATVATGPEPLVRHRTGTHGVPVVLVNALGQDLGPWQDVVRALLPRLVITWNLRGLTPPLPARAFDQHVDDLAEVLTAEGVDGCHLVAWCTGGKTALRFDRRFPGRVRSMVLLNPSFKHPGRDGGADTAYEKNLEALCRAVARRPETAARLRDMFVPGAFASSGDAGGAESAVRQAFGSAQALIAYTGQHLEFWADNPLTEPATTTPVLFVGAQRDEIVATDAVRQIARTFPHGSYVEVPEAGHFALIEQAQRVAGLIEGFILAAEI